MRRAPRQSGGGRRVIARKRPIGCRDQAIQLAAESIAEGADCLGAVDGERVHVIRGYL